MNLIGTKVSSKTIESISEAVFPKEDFNPDEVVELLIVCETPFIIREFNSYLHITDRIYGRMLDWNLHRYSHLPDFQLRIDRITTGSSIISVVQELGYLTPLLIVYIALKYLPNAFKTVTESVKNLSEAYKHAQEAKYLIPAQVRKLDFESSTDRNVESILGNWADSSFESMLRTKVDLIGKEIFRPSFPASLTPPKKEKLDHEVLKYDEKRKALILNRKELETALRQDEMFKGLSEKQLKQIPNLLKDLLSKEKNDISKARRFAIKNVKEVKIRKKRRKE